MHEKLVWIVIYTTLAVVRYVKECFFFYSLKFFSLNFE